MKRIDALKLIANQLDFLNNRSTGYRTEFTKRELSNADVILTTLEEAGMLPPTYLKYVKHPAFSDGVKMTKEVREWEDG